MKSEYPSLNKLFPSASKRNQEVIKYLNNYIGQLENHFDLTEEDIVKILKFVVESRKSTILNKKWWNIWR